MTIFWDIVAGGHTGVESGCERALFVTASSPSRKAAVNGKSQAPSFSPLPNHLKKWLIFKGHELWKAYKRHDSPFRREMYTNLCRLLQITLQGACRIPSIPCSHLPMHPPQAHHSLGFGLRISSYEAIKLAPLFLTWLAEWNGHLYLL